MMVLVTAVVEVVVDGGKTWGLKTNNTTGRTPRKNPTTIGQTSKANQKERYDPIYMNGLVEKLNPCPSRKTQKAPVDSRGKQGKNKKTCNTGLSTLLVTKLSRSKTKVVKPGTTSVDGSVAYFRCPPAG